MRKLTTFFEVFKLYDYSSASNDRRPGRKIYGRIVSMSKKFL